MVKLDKLFDMVCHMRDNPNKDYQITKAVALNREQQHSLVKRSIQSFMQAETGTIDEVNGKPRLIQAFSGSSDLPILTKDVFNVVNTVPNFDTSWQMSFKGIQLKRGQLNWEITDVATGIVFELVPEGGKAKFYGVSGNKVTAGIEKYGAGIMITWEMIEGRKLYQFIDMMNQVRSRLFTLWGDVHYGLLGVGAAVNAITWQGVATDPTMSRDIATINAGYTQIANACKDKGYGDTANAEILLYVSPLLKDRVMQAFRATSNDMTAGRVVSISGIDGRIVEYNVRPIFTWNTAITANTGIMILPGNKIQNSAYMQELSLSEKDIETLNDLRSYWSAFGAVVADTDQCAQVSFV